MDHENEVFCDVSDIGEIRRSNSTLRHHENIHAGVTQDVAMSTKYLSRVEGIDVRMPTSLSPKGYRAEATLGDCLLAFEGLCSLKVEVAQAQAADKRR